MQKNSAKKITALKFTSNFTTSTLQSGMTYDKNGKLSGFNAKVGFAVGAFSATSTAITDSMMANEAKEDASWGEQERFDVKNKLISNTLFNGMAAAYQMSTGTKMTSQLRTNNALTLEDYAGRAAGMATKNLAPQKEVKPQDEKEAERRKDSPLGKMLDMMEGALNAVGYGLKKAADTAMEVAGAIKNGAVAFGQKVINGVTAVAGMVANSDLGQKVGNLVGGIASGDGLYWENDREQAGRYYQENYGSLETVSYEGTEYGNFKSMYDLKGAEYKSSSIEEEYGKNCATAFESTWDDLSQKRGGNLDKEVTSFLEEVKKDPSLLEFDDKSEKALGSLEEAYAKGEIKKGSPEYDKLLSLRDNKNNFELVKKLITNGDASGLGDQATDALCNVIAHYAYGKATGQLKGSSFIDFYKEELSKGLIGGTSYDKDGNLIGNVFYGKGSGAWKERFGLNDNREINQSVKYTDENGNQKNGYIVVEDSNGSTIVKDKVEEKYDPSQEKIKGNVNDAYKTVDSMYARDKEGTILRNEKNEPIPLVDALNSSGKNFAIIWMKTNRTDPSKTYQGNHWFIIAKDKNNTWRQWDHNNRERGNSVDWSNTYGLSY